MPYVTFMDKTFNPASYPGATDADRKAAVLAEAGKMFGTYSSDPNTLAPPEVVFNGADSFVRAIISPTKTAVTRGFRNKAEMDANLAYAAGVKVNCFDPDGTKRGRYVKVGSSGSGSWSYEGAIDDYLWNDPNHVGRLLNLIPFGSWVDSTPPFPLRGPMAIYDVDTLVPADDWRGVRLTFTLRAVELSKGPWTKIALHCQGSVDSLTAVLPQVHPSGNYALPNFFNVRQLISDQLGFSAAGTPDAPVSSWGKPDVVPSVIDSGWVDVVVDFTPDDRDWVCLGRIDRPLSASAYHYVACPVSRLLQKLTGNIYWLVVYEKPAATEDTYWAVQSAQGVTPEERLTGQLLLKRIKAEYLTA